MWKGCGAAGTESFRSVTGSAGEIALPPAIAIPIVQTPTSTRPAFYLVGGGIILGGIDLYCCLIFGLT